MISLRPSTSEKTGASRKKPEAQRYHGPRTKAKFKKSYRWKVQAGLHAGESWRRPICRAHDLPRCPAPLLSRSTHAALVLVRGRRPPPPRVVMPFGGGEGRRAGVVCCPATARASSWASTRCDTGDELSGLDFGVYLSARQCTL